MNKKKKEEDFLKGIEAKLKREASQKKKNKNFNEKKPGQPAQGMNRFAFFLFIALLVFTFILLQRGTKDDKQTELAYSDFLIKVENKEIPEVVVVNDSIIEFSLDGIDYSTRIPYMDIDLVNRLIDSNVEVNSVLREESQLFVILMQWLPWIILMVFFWFIISRQMRGRGNEAFSFGKSKAKMVNSEEIKERFHDVKGCDEAISDLQDVVSFLRNPQKFAELGAHVPKGILLVGSPGTGKTLLARAVAGEARVPFFSMSGSDFVEMFVGVGASRVRDLFQNGKKHSPCIIFVDEIDAVGRTRGAGYGGGHDEREQTLNQLLVEMDGFSTEAGIILIAATNRPDVLDKALLRPGRFDRQVIVDVPDMKGRRAILEVHAKKVKVDPKLDFTALARGTAGFTGADLANIINEAALLAAKEGKARVSNNHLELAKDKVMLGAEKRSLYVSPEEKTNTAYHEAGHALISLLVKHSNTLHKVSIIPRGRALGLTYFLPEDGRLTMRKSFLEAELRVLYGGRVAEEIIFKDVTNGAMNDIERATRIAKAMVCEWGFSRLGAIAYSENKTSGYLPGAQGGDVSNLHSEEISKKIDSEVKRILDEAYSETKRLLKKNISKLKKLAVELLNKETLSEGEVYKLLGMKPQKRSENPTG